MQAQRLQTARGVYAGVAAFVLVLAVDAAQAQRVTAVAPVPAPSAAALAAMAAPSPGGLRSPLPAGLTGGSGAAAARDPVAATTSPIGTADTTAGMPGQVTILNNTVAGTGSGVRSDGLYAPVGVGVNTAVMGAAPAYGVARGPAGSVPLGGAGYSAVDIARSFLGADANRDGELTRGEAQRLSISMMSFEEMDRNFDGVITRGEYEDGLR